MCKYELVQLSMPEKNITLYSWMQSKELTRDTNKIRCNTVQDRFSQKSWKDKRSVKRITKKDERRNTNRHGKMVDRSGFQVRCKKYSTMSSSNNNQSLPTIIAFYIIAVIVLPAAQNQQPITLLCKAVANKMAGQKSPFHFVGSMHSNNSREGLHQSTWQHQSYSGSQHPITEYLWSTVKSADILQKRLCNFATQYFPVMIHNSCNIISPIERHPRCYTSSPGLSPVHIPAFQL